jgi:hypothetical protein
MSNRTYILQKDFLVSDGDKGASYKAGTEIKIDQNSELHYRFPNRELIWHEIVENNPEWFLPKEDKVEVTFSFMKGHDDGTCNYYMATSKEIPEVKYESVKRAIEFVLNARWEVYYEGYKVTESVKFFTEKELLEAEEKAFNAGRDVWIGKLPYRPDGGKPICHTYPTFLYYKSKQQ